MVFIKNRHRDGIYFLQFLTFYFFMEFEFLPINKMWFCTLWFRTKMLWIFHFFSLVRLWKVVLLLIRYIFEFSRWYIGTEICWYVLAKLSIKLSIIYYFLRFLTIYFFNEIVFLPIGFVLYDLYLNIVNFSRIFHEFFIFSPESKIVHLLNYPVTFLYIECHFNLLFC